MGRDTTAGKRMAAKRSREKAAGLRRLNVAVRPEVINRLAVLMRKHNCSSQAGIIEFLVMAETEIVPVCMADDVRNEVTAGCSNAQSAASSYWQNPTSKITVPEKTSHSTDKDPGMVSNKKSLIQLGLFEI